ncbi:MAG: hypothetical protein EOP83_21110 [Verrucomicrobiaceae bacterium]|nr:MAG: hypothetical protein EOP83_21110 [Verrucomicrobiaceae bacterium]
MHQTFPSRSGVVLVLVCLTGIVGCDGPNEKAGRDADRVEAQAAGRNVSGEGPNERLGEAQDRVERADARATDAAADALEEKGDRMRAQADLAADRLDEQARSLRAGATKTIR